MKKGVLILATLSTLLLGDRLVGEYSAKYGIFGTIAKARGVYDWNRTNYRISVEAWAVGFAAKLSKNLREKFESEGRIENGVLIPAKYQVEIKRGNKLYHYTYLFDRKLMIIQKLRYFNGKLESNETLPYWVNQDILSLYFSLPKLLKPGKREYTFYALGARKSDGRLDLRFLTPEEVEELEGEIGPARNAYFFRLNFYNKVFAGDRGILYLVVSKDNFVTLKGVVKNILKIGDLKGFLDRIRYFRGDFLKGGQ